MGTGDPFPGAKRGRVVTLAIYLHLVLDSVLFGHLSNPSQIVAD
jgi:hypothetical protein